jgi:AAHS family 4-hydroxybenzoate transporter-like MFS transporter
MASRGNGMSGRTVDIAGIIEGQKINPFWVRLLVVSCFVTFFDGYDMQVIAFASIYIAPDLHLTRTMLGEIFSIGIVGTLVGGILLGFVADKVGRRPTIIFAVLSFAVLTFAMGFARTYEQFMILRFLNGITIGGAIPLCWALNVEYAPRSARATVVTIIMMGYSLGGGICGPIAVWLEPKFGWPAVFFFGGIGSLVSAALVWLALPESIRFLTAQNKRPDLIAKILRRLAPKEAIPEGATFVLGDERKEAPKFKFGDLFEGPLRVITPLLWATYVVSSSAVWFKANWAPVVLTDMGFSRPEAALAASLTSLAGALGGLALMRFTDRMGPISIASLPLIGVPLLLFAAYGPIGGPPFIILNTVIGFCIVGAHTGVTSINSVYYPSAIRANGAGWVSSVGKIGSIAGPLIGGLVLSTTMPARYTFALLAITQVLLALFVGALGLYHGYVGRKRAAEPAVTMVATT